MKRRHFIFAALAVALTGVLAVAALGATNGTINGTPKNDVLKGTPKADVINGGAGNDKLYGYAGNDTLNGGTGNDTLVGGPGADKLNCGAGKDIAMAGKGDTVSKSCEVVKGLPSNPPPSNPPPSNPPPTNPPPVTARAGHYTGTTSQGKPLTFDVPTGGTTVTGFNTSVEVNCVEIQGFTVNETLDLSQVVFPVKSDLTFGDSAQETLPDGSTVSLTVNGQLSATAGATGTLRFDINITDLPNPGDLLHCSTGDMTWTAS